MSAHLPFAPHPHAHTQAHAAKHAEHARAEKPKKDEKHESFAATLAQHVAHQVSHAASVAAHAPAESNAAHAHASTKARSHTRVAEGTAPTGEAASTEARAAKPVAPVLTKAVEAKPTNTPTASAPEPIGTPTKITAPAALAPLPPAEGQVQGSVLMRAAHLSIEQPGQDRVEMHLRIRDGLTEVRIDSAVPASFRARAEDLRVTLAHEGLSLGNLELGNSGHRAPEPREELVAPARAPQKIAATILADEPVSRGSGIHVKA